MSAKHQLVRRENLERHTERMSLHGDGSSASSELISGYGALIPTVGETILICVTLEFFLVLVKY